MIDENIPDPIWHRNISFIKSGLRIIAGLFLVLSHSFLGAGIFLILAEVLGIIEEIV
jgi:hypothetical protein